MTDFYLYFCCYCYYNNAKCSCSDKATPAVSFHHHFLTPLMFLPFFLTSCFTPGVQVMCPSMLFHRPCTAVISLFPQVEVGDIIKVNGSDYVPADAAILSSRYRSPTCCQAVGTSPFFPSLRLLSLVLSLSLAQHSLKKWWLDRAVSQCCPIQTF